MLNDEDIKAAAEAEIPTWFTEPGLAKEAFEEVDFINSREAQVYFNILLTGYADSVRDSDADKQDQFQAIFDNINQVGGCAVYYEKFILLKSILTDEQIPSLTPEQRGFVTRWINADGFLTGYIGVGQFNQERFNQLLPSGSEETKGEDECKATEELNISLILRQSLEEAIIAINKNPSLLTDDVYNEINSREDSQAIFVGVLLVIVSKAKDSDVWQQRLAHLLKSRQVSVYNYSDLELDVAIAQNSCEDGELLKALNAKYRGDLRSIASIEDPVQRYQAYHPVTFRVPMHGIAEISDVNSVLQHAGMLTEYEISQLSDTQKRFWRCFLSVVDWNNQGLSRVISEGAFARKRSDWGTWFDEEERSDEALKNLFRDLSADQLTESGFPAACQNLKSSTEQEESKESHELFQGVGESRTSSMGGDEHKEDDQERESKWEDDDSPEASVSSQFGEPGLLDDGSMYESILKHFRSFSGDERKAAIRELELKQEYIRLATDWIDAEIDRLRPDIDKDSIAGTRVNQLKTFRQDLEDGIKQAIVGNNSVPESIDGAIAQAVNAQYRNFSQKEEINQQRNRIGKMVRMFGKLLLGIVFGASVIGIPVLLGDNRFGKWFCNGDTTTRKHLNEAMEKIGAEDKPANDNDEETTPLLPTSSRGSHQ
ncbi:MAG: hypothetical protein ACE365_02515 [Gammaproteobacteria bacterium]